MLTLRLTLLCLAALGLSALAAPPLLANGHPAGDGAQYGPPVPPDSIQNGIASYYADRFEGRPTASGEQFIQDGCTAAHPWLPFGSILRVVNEQNRREVVVRVNDRGPFVKGRIIDLSRSAAEELQMISAGTVPVRIEVLVRGGS